jgi:hypothetical protein
MSLYVATIPSPLAKRFVIVTLPAVHGPVNGRRRV